MTTDPLDRATALLEAGRLDEALAITAPLAETAEPTHHALAVHSTVLKALGRREHALAFDQRAVMRFPSSAVGWHNLAATLGDMGRSAESVAAMERGMAMGLDGALSWGVMARARTATGDLTGAQQAYEQVMRRAANRVETAIEYADLVWMRDGDLAAAQAVLDRSAHAGGPPAPLLLAKAKLFETAGQADKGADLLAMAAERLPDEPAVLMAAAQAALERDRLDEAERLALGAEKLFPRGPTVMNQLAIVYLAQGKADLALAKARAGLEILPHDQSLLGWAAMAARALGDPLYGQLYDYEAMVGAYDIATPNGWPTLEAYLADLAIALNGLHRFSEHPAAQSLRHGTQTTYRLTGSGDRAIRAFFKAIELPMRQHLAAMGQGADPLRSRNTGGYRVEGAWSVRLRPGGFHKDHFHAEGWLSSAFYVETPETALDTAERQGWLRLGQPPFKTQPPMAAEHFVRPKPGRLVLFPSYMWHGTVPFETDEKRLTIAFDAVPV
ncbi:putative 2OG-Fe(II) oxygenase [Phenylobacterium sp.]|uniref:putative 2OG-Fe(II) oxygenase n=1 Tax=Phenylobacterium sp. TaxID=1871053 RepID=UPI0025F866FB|nr:putative 2OG-Fe(II) oxygenase [Phenylobacterium sp.]